MRRRYTLCTKEFSFPFVYRLVVVVDDVIYNVERMLEICVVHKENGENLL